MASETAHDKGRLPVRVAVEHESELVVRGLQAMLAPHSDSIVLVPSRSAEGRMYDLTLYEPARDTDGPGRTPATPRPGARVAYSWDCSHATVSTEMSRGAAGYISKWVPAARLVQDLLQIHRGRVVVDVQPAQSREDRREDRAATAWPLTDRETEVLTLIATGLSNQDITDRLHLSINSVKSYIRSVYGKIEVSSRSQAVLWAVRHGLLLRDAGAEVPAEAVPSALLRGGRTTPVRPGAVRATPVRSAGVRRAPVGATPVRSAAVGTTPVRPAATRPRPAVPRSA
jgi:DNA-binding CsgD family transcriptional regulator